MQILANQSVLNAHSRKNQVSFEQLHMNPDITELPDCFYPVLLNDLEKVKELATKDTVIIANGYGKHLKVSVIKEFDKGLKLPLIESSLKSFEEIASKGLADFVESLQKILSIRMEKAYNVFSGKDLIEKSNTREEIFENSGRALEVLKTLPEMDKDFNEAVSNFQKAQKERSVKQVKEIFFNEVLADPEI